VITTAAAPVQAEGTVGGRPFYFRARHDEGSFAVAEVDGVDPADFEASEPGRAWVRSGRFAERGAGSHLSAAAADALIQACAAAYGGEAAT
jgi:hypothetical protein